MNFTSKNFKNILFAILGLSFMVSCASESQIIFATPPAKYLDALTKIPGTTSLINISYKEDWYWWIIGTARKVTISGEAIKEIE